MNRWGIMTAADALRERVPLRYLIDGVLPAGALAMMYGAPGSLKSMLLADLMVCVATGKAWLAGGNHEGYECRQAPVLWVDLDNGRRRTSERLGAMLRGHGGTEETPLLYTSMPVPPLDASSDAHMWALADIVTSHGVGLLAVDNLGLVLGTVQENAAEMAGVMGRWRMLVEETGCAVVLIHHQRKSQTTGSDGRRGDAVRGHSSIEASLDLALHVGRDGTDPVVTVSATKVRDYLRRPVFGARFTYLQVASERDLASATFVGYQVITAQEQLVIDLEAAILDLLRARGALTQQDVVGIVRAGWEGDPPGINRIRDTLKTMSATGKIEARDVGRAVTYLAR